MNSFLIPIAYTDSDSKFTHTLPRRPTFFYHLGNNLFTLGMIGLVWNFPRSLGRLPIIPALVVFMLFFMLNENMEWTELPGNSVLVQVPVYWLLGIILISAQWIRSRGRPLDRAAIKVLTMMLGILILSIAGVYFASIFLHGYSTVSLTGSFLGLFTFYIILALAVQRYHLFGIDRWWAEIWLWFFAGAVIITFDMALVTGAHMVPSYALSASVIAVGWLYFPVRQRVWEKLFHHRPSHLEEYVPMLISHFVRQDHADNMQFWKQVLNDIFRPLIIEVRQEGVPNVMIVENGVRLRIPCLIPECSIDLAHADKGKRLFNSDDIKLTQALFNILERAAEQREVYMQGILNERKRIMRDLHDDIGGRLLTLAHAEHSEVKTAADALKSLREIIYSLDTEQRVTVNAAIARQRIESLERCELAKVSFEWHWQELAHDIELTPRQFLNLMLICREGLSNVFRHAKNGCVVFDWHVEREKLQVKIMNDGVEDCPRQLKPGKGLRNMRIRVEELGGKFEYICEDKTFCVIFSIPLDESFGARDA